MKILCIGAGLMGAQIGAEYALAGHTVTFLVRDAERGRSRVESAISDASRYGITTEKHASEALGRMQVVSELDDAANGVDIVVESIPEDFELKAATLEPVASRFTNAIIATNTSSISLRKLAQAIGAPGRTVGTHYLNPPLFTPLVELAILPDVDPAIADRMRQTIRSLGKVPLTVNGEVAGYIWNRLQFALLREAIWLVEEGGADPDTVDDVVQLGLAPRWRLVPPFKSAALGGTETFIRAAANVIPSLSTADGLEGLRAVASLSPNEVESLTAGRDESLAADRRKRHTFG